MPPTNEGECPPPLKNVLSSFDEKKTQMGLVSPLAISGESPHPHPTSDCNVISIMQLLHREQNQRGGGSLHVVVEREYKELKWDNFLLSH